MPLSIRRPAAGEYADFHKGYIAALGDVADAVAALEAQARMLGALAAVPDGAAAFRYAPGKWSVREVTGHLADAERVMTYRLLRTCRGDATPLAGFDENTYVPAGAFEARTQADVGAELLAVRAGTLALVRSLTPESLDRRTVINGWSLTTRAQAFIIAGHVAHHLGLLRGRYGLTL